MPISPQMVAEKRIENTVNKLCDLIDKKLQESEDLPFEFRFLPNTSPQVENSVMEIYRNVGWVSSMRMIEDEHVLVLQYPHTHPKATEEEETPSNQNKPKPIAKPDSRENIIEVALQSIDGKIKLAHSVVEPISISLMYQSITRKLLMIDELSENQKPKYKHNEHENPIYFASDRTVKPYTHDVLDDFVKFSALAEVTKEDIEGKAYYEIDRAQVLLKDSLENQETMALLALLQASIQSEQQVIHTYGERSGARGFTRGRTHRCFCYRVCFCS